MQQCNLYQPVCSGCGGSGRQPIPPDETTECPMCGGTGRQISGIVEIDIPTTAQFVDKFEQIENALQAIWNKVKDL